jgi:hypothetical protein
VGHNTFLEPTLILIMSISVDPVHWFMRKLALVIVSFCAKVDIQRVGRKSS